MTRLSWTISLVTALTAACASGQAQEPATQPRPRATAALADRSPAPAHEALTAAVEQLGAGIATDPEARHRALVALADALDTTETFASDAVREIAMKLRSSPPTSRDVGPLLQQAFARVLQTLGANAAPASTAVEYRRAVSTLARAVESLDDASALTHHADEIVAFRSATDAVHLLGGHPAPFRQAANARAERTVPLQSYDIEVAEARRDVTELARTSWSRSHVAASRALASLADVVDLADTCGASPEAAAIRFEARRMRWVTGAGVLQSRSVKTALSLVLDVLERIQTAESSAATKSARASLANIEPNRSIAFQHARIQDAFRATMGVFNSLPPPSARSCVRASK